MDGDRHGKHNTRATRCCIISKGETDIGTGNGGLLSQFKMQNEMRLTDESWINYQKGKGNEEFQKYMEDLTDMQNHVLPYLQSFCSLEKKECRNAGNSR